MLRLDRFRQIESETSKFIRSHGVHMCSFISSIETSLMCVPMYQ